MFTRDYPLVQGVVLITASTYVLVNLLVDLSYSLLNPRIRIGEAGLVERTDSVVRLTPRGMLLSNEVFQKFV